MAVTFVKKQAEVVGSLYSLTNPVERAYEGATQTFTRGQWLQLQSASGNVIITAIADTPELIVGAALQAASGTTGADVAYQPFVAGTLIEANLLTGTSDFVFAAANRFLSVGYSITSGLFVLDVSETAAADTLAMILDTARAVTTIGTQAKGAVGDTNVRVRAVITQSAFIRTV